MINVIKIFILFIQGVGASAFLGAIIYSVRNTAVNGNQFSFHPDLFLNCWLLGSLGVLFLGLIASLPLGEMLLSLFLPIRRRSQREAEVMDSAVKLVQDLYEKRFGRILKLKTFVADIPDVNGFAFGNGCVVLSRGMLKVASEDEVASLVAHEVGHLHHNDGTRNLIALSMGMPVRFVYRLIFGASDDSAKNDKETRPAEDGWTPRTILFVMLTYFAPYFFVMLVLYPLIAFVSNFLDKYTEWPLEYNADAFATKLGFGEDLIAVLEYYEENDVRIKEGFLKKYDYSHPPIALRIDRIERLIP